MIILAQSDTTVGFFSTDYRELNRVKNRALSRPVIALVDSFCALKTAVRVPNIHKNSVRRSKKTTFIYGDLNSYRVVKNLPFKHQIYSTSANIASKKFDETWAKNVSDVWIVSPDGFSEHKPSDLIKLGKKTKKKLR